MARTNENGLELTFHPSGRWFKRGKQFPSGTKYFGPGKSKNDTASYQSALANYRQWQSEQQTSKVQSETVQRVLDVLKAVNGMRPDANAVARFDGTPDAAAIVAALAGTRAEGTQVQGYLVARADQEARRTALAEINTKPTDHVVAAAQHAQPVTVKGINTVAALVDLFDADNESRNQEWHLIRTLAAQGKEATAKKDQVISDGHLAKFRSYGERFKKFFINRAWNGEGDTARTILEEWQRQAKKKIDELKGTGLAGFDKEMAFGRRLMQWAYDNHHLKGMPRNLKKLTRKYDVKKSTATAIPLADLHKLYREAADDMRAWIALGLNCGFYAMDVALTKGKQIGDVHLDHWRNKTMNTASVNVKYKLWGITRTLIERSRTQADAADVIWRTRKGHPLVHFKTESRTRGKTSVIAQQFAKLCKECALLDTEGRALYDFTNLRDTGSTAVEQIDPTMTDLYLAHSDPRMARLYIDGKMDDTTPLDAVMVELEKRMALPKVQAKKPQRKKKAVAAK